jgi:hypothetical protein
MEDKTVITTAPPPPSEVKIRTMRSDIDSMMKSGGGAPSYRNVSITGLSLDEKFKVPTTFIQAPMPTPGLIRPSPEGDNMPQPYSPVDRPVIGQEVSDAGPWSDLVPKLIIGLVGLIALGVVAYFAYTIFAK